MAPSAKPGDSGVAHARPDDPALADRAGDMASIYVHVPFCHRVCPYCDFTVVAGRMDAVERYFEAVAKEIFELPPWRPLDSVFVGGGTPSAVPAPLLAGILEALRSGPGLVGSAEITLEANPEDWLGGHARALREAGFTRVSLGAQSFDSDVLDSLGRQHTPEMIGEAVDASSEFESVSLDLIYGTPSESMSSWVASVEQAIALGVDHISVYSLTVEPGTDLWKAVRSGAPGPDADDQADKWETASDLLECSGYIRYEVSNYAKPGHACRYNLSVWDQGEYAAVGVGAHGYRHGIRSVNVRRLDTYMDRVERGLGPVQSSDLVEGWAGEQERLMLGLRRAAGVVAGEGGRRLLESDDGCRLVDAGVVTLSGDRLVVTRPLITDEVIRAVLSLEAGFGEV